jgi:O-antigen/teichoic acid export membrane protein
LYMALMLAGAYTLYRFEWLSPATALGLMGFASLAVSLWLVIRLRVERPSLRDDSLAREALENHWKYGRWSVATQALTWAPGYIYYLILPFWGGLEASASLRALMNLILPLLMAVQAMSTLLIPSLGTVRGEAKFGILVRFAVVAAVLGSVSYWLLLGLLHDPLIAWLYGGRYTENAGLLWILGLMPVSAGVVHVLAAALRASERPDQVYWAYLFSTAVALPLGIVAVFAWGIIGAVVGLLTYSVATVGAMTYLFFALKSSMEGGAKHR